MKLRGRFAVQWVMRVRCGLILLVANLLSVSLHVHAQAAGEQSKTPEATGQTLSVAAKLVNLPVVIRDKKGALVQNVPKDDFVLQVDGKPQAIRYFDQDRDTPLILGLMVDTSQSQRQVLDEERTASVSFLDQMMTGAKDQAFVIQFARQVDLLQDVTTSRPKLRAALKEIDSTDAGGGQGGSGGSSGGSQSDPQDPSGGGNGQRGSGGRGGRASHGGGTTLYDALFLSSDEIMGKQKGRKALIILSDGVDNGSKESLTKSLETAQRSDTIVYAIYFKGEDGGGGSRGFGFPGGGFPGGGGRGGGGIGGGNRGGGGGGYPRGGGGGERVDGKKILERMVHETGGRLFEVTKKQTVEQIYTQIGQELRAQYRLSFTPDQATAEEGYHEIALTLRTADEKKLTVQTRDGYYTRN